MNRDEARRRVRDIIPAEDTTPLVFEHPALEQPLPAGDLAVIITRLRAGLDADFPEPIPTPSHLVGVEQVTPDEALAIARFLRLHFDGFERRQGHTLLQPSDGHETSVTDVELHVTMIE